MSQMWDYVVIIGLGGTGSHLVEPAARLLAYHPRGTQNICLIDGDKFEEKNQSRQLFDPAFINQNKAAAAASRIASVSNTLVIERYIDYQSFIGIMNDTGAVRPLVILSVDNHQTRKQVMEVMQDMASKFEYLTVISPGNDVSHGQALIWHWAYGVDITPNPLEQPEHEELRNPKDRIPQMGCSDTVVSTPQLITANACAALAVLLSMQAMLDEEDWHSEVQFDTRRMKLVARGEKISKQEVAK
jgi:hypothetical protein